jgi:hypothetical protein
MSKRRYKFMSVKKLKEVDQELYSEITGDEKALADAMLQIVGEFGKFGSETSNVYPNYMSPAQNEDKEIGVKCGNCVFHVETEESFGCSAIVGQIEEEGICRLAVIPPGLVDSNTPMSEAAATYKVPAGAQSAAKRALKWIADGKAGDGFTSTGRRRASQLASGGTVSRDTVARMKSYFARHTVDRQANGFFAGEKNYPSPGRVAWDAWGGDAGRTWVNGIDLEEARTSRKRKRKYSK